MIDQEKFARAYVSDPKLYKNCPSFFMCSSPYFTADGRVKPDIEKAKKLIAESGYDGTPVVVLHATESGPTNTFSLVAEQLMRQIGLKVEPQAMDWATLVGRRASKETVDKGAGRSSCRGRRAQTCSSRWDISVFAPTVRRHGSAGPATRKSRNCAATSRWRPTPS
ncbi:hypothetical protein GWG65_22910 [Bradyrhizobium sp. CSA207]|nr:hypothetical protein [Bradyrhizobium sp. CSA207]